MKKIIMLLPLAAALTSCETTGDPNQGGYWNWSEKKAVARQDALSGELRGINEEGDRLKSRRSSLQSQRASLRRKITVARKRVVKAKTPKAKKAANSELISLNRQLAALESL